MIFDPRSRLVVGIKHREDGESRIYLDRPGSGRYVVTSRSLAERWEKKWMSAGYVTVRIPLNHPVFIDPEYADGREES